MTSTSWSDLAGTRIAAYDYERTQQTLVSMLGSYAGLFTTDFTRPSTKAGSQQTFTVFFDADAISSRLAALPEPIRAGITPESLFGIRGQYAGRVDGVAGTFTAYSKATGQAVAAITPVVQGLYSAKVVGTQVVTAPGAIMLPGVGLAPSPPAVGGLLLVGLAVAAFLLLRRS